MIELPSKPKPNQMTPGMIDRGYILRGASSLRVDRAGNRWAFNFTYPPMQQDEADTFTAPLARAKRQGVRIYLPVRVPQGIPGAPLVDGAVTAAASSLDVKGLNVGYVARVGFWLTIVDADGVGYLHRVVETVVADGSGNATLQIEPPLRAPFADGDTVHLGKPFIEGFIDGQQWTYDIGSDEFTTLSLTVEEF